MEEKKIELINKHMDHGKLDAVSIIIEILNEECAKATLKSITEDKNNNNEYEEN